MGRSPLFNCDKPHKGREREWNTNFLFLKISGAPGISRQNPGMSRPKSLISLVSRDISNYLAPTPSRGRPPPHRRISGPKSLGLGSFFVPEKATLRSFRGFQPALFRVIKKHGKARFNFHRPPPWPTPSGGPRINSARMINCNCNRSRR